MRPQRALAVLLSLAAAAAPVRAQEAPPLSVEWIYSGEGENVTKMPESFWTTTGELLLLDETTPEAERTLERFTPATGQRRPAMDRTAALASLRRLIGETAMPPSLEWPESFDEAGTRALYTFAGDLFVLDLLPSRFERVTRTPAEEETGRLSPDGRKVAFVRDNDLYVHDLSDGSERRLTSDGSSTLLNGVLSWVYWEEIFDKDGRAYWWSPDSAALAFLRTDESPVSEVVFLDFAPAVPNVIRQRYPKAGTANPRVGVGVVDVASGATAWVDPAQAPWEYVMGVTWVPDSRRVAIQATNRMQTRLDLYLVERATGEAARILTEEDTGWVNQHDLQFLASGSRFVWSSERDGYTHLYLYESDGTLVARLTAGDWSVRGPGGFYAEALGSTFVDEAAGQVYFTALEKSVIERHLYRVGLDGSGLERVTKEDGVHSITFSPDRSAWTDTFSAHCTPPSLVVHRAAGGQTTMLATSRAGLKKELDWQCPELTTVPGNDGHPLHVRLIRPPGFDPAKRYPAIVYIYGGPSAPVVKDSWDYSFARNAPFDQLLARRGYVVMNVDPRSATAASKTTQNAVARNVWADGELADMLAGVRWLKAQSWIDGGRVGVWGWSGGGTSTLLLMTRSTEFRAGIAVAPNTNWRYYDTKFAEAYMKPPADNPEGYENTNLVARAKDLHGRLMLVHGTYDDNVHPQQTWAVVDELIEAGKRFDLMMYPMRQHTIEDRPARIDLFKRMLEFWERNL